MVGQPFGSGGAGGAPASESGSAHGDGFTPPAVALPKGGGAIRGIGEKFTANPVTGTGTMSVPLATTPGRSGFGPELSLSCDTGSGNGLFGFGWGLSLPSITRKTDKGLPRYVDDGPESDVFILSGAEDLAPVLVEQAGKWREPATTPRTLSDGSTWHVRRYRPRTESLFARIERWTNVEPGLDSSVQKGATHWRSISRDNVTTLYGMSEESRVADPADPLRVFSWLICESYDDKGNAILYRYKDEDATDVDGSQAHERNRTDDGRSATRSIISANRYIKRIQYGNGTPRQAGETLKLRNDWLFEVVFDYGEHDPKRPAPDDKGDWLCRHDPFSSCRSGFELRTYRLCQRVLMFHHFPKEPDLGRNCLVRSTDFAYRSNRGDPEDVRRGHPVASFIASVTQSGYRRDSGSYLKRSLPPLEFEYSEAIIHDELQEVDPKHVENLPEGVDGNRYQWADLDGEGSQGALTQQGNGWYYKRNLSADHDGQDGAARFGPLELVAQIPALAALGKRGQQLLDLAGDGKVDLVELGGPSSGFHERTEEASWSPFRPFEALPNIAWDDPNLRFADLTGDGRADVLVTEDDVLTWYPSLGEEGFDRADRVTQPLDEESGPRLVFADGTQSVFLADTSADGLPDLVRIRNGEVCCWHNLGYGHFGAKVTMDNGPWFDAADAFDPARIRLGDSDGSGSFDIFYLRGDGVQLYLNQSGNSWSDAHHLSSLQVDDLSSVTVVDLVGNGTACLVSSSPLPADAARPMRYVDLMGGVKPHLLVGVRNNLGAQTRVRYAPSTKFYLQDRRAGRPWITRLPFAVHVVERVETVDGVSRNRFVTRYAYHHGYFDGEEREFRGFGMVEQWDTEEFATLAGDGTPPGAVDLDAAWNVPPVLTRTWFHTGIYAGRDHVSDLFAGLYYREPGLTPAEAAKRLLPDTVLPGDLAIDEEREACRALKGAMLRQEVYGLDRSEQEARPYTVTEQNFTIQRVQGRGANRHAAFFTHAREAITYQYERDLSDPRIAHALTLDVDPYGNVRRSLAVGYGRSQSPFPAGPDRDRQTTALITYTESAFTDVIDQRPDDYRTPLPAETHTYELTGFTPGAGAARFSFEEWTRDDFAWLDSATDAQKRLVEHVRTVYRKDDLTEFLPLRRVEPLALRGESYRLALTPDLLAGVFKRAHPGHADDDLLPDPAAILEGTAADRGGYVEMEGSWWVPTGSVFYAETDRLASLELSEARSHFFLARRYRDPFGHDTVVSYGPDGSALAGYDLLVTRTSDALGNTVTVDNNYRVLQPELITDPNGNRTAAAFDALGMVVATAVMGKEGENLGDLLEDVDADPSLPTLRAFVAQPHTHAASLIGKATTRIVYDLDCYRRAGQPPYAATLARETHAHDLSGSPTRIQVAFAYTDGFGREIQKKIQAEPGDAPKRHPPAAAADLRLGELMRSASGELIQCPAANRWVGSGRTVFNNKGKPVRKYEPFFSSTNLYEPERELTDTGVSPVLFYDPVGRVVATLHPNNTYEKVVFDAWQQTTYDANDTVTASLAQTGDPRTDPDIAGYVHEYFKTQPAAWQTWYAQRSGLPSGPQLDAARKAARHADTPTVAHLDVLGRPYMTVAHNRYTRDGATVDKHCAIRVELDLEGNQRTARDERANPAGGLEQRIVMRADYDLLRNRIHQSSIDAGERWMLNDVAGKPLRRWDTRRFLRRMTYDALRRLTGLFVTDESGAERLAERTVYGEGQGDTKNHRSRVYRVSDDAGVVTNVEYDFKGNLRDGRRDLLNLSAQEPDWLQNPATTDGSFTTRTTYDALNRLLTVTSPDQSVYRPTFNEANLLNAIEVEVHGAKPATVFVTNIEYDAKGQRQLIGYSNGATTTYEYDPLTFRLTNVKTIRAGPDVTASQLFKEPTVIQDLRYTYDPTGNITQIEDSALKTVFNGNQRVAPVGDFTYDALYRLVAAEGREHIGQMTLQFTPNGGNYRDYPFAGHAHPNDFQAMRSYTEHYGYDAVGNFETMRHVANGGSWTRSYEHKARSLIEPGKQSNRLTGTALHNGTIQTDAYPHDEHGNMKAMPQLPSMAWDFADRLEQAELVGGRARYVYDAAGQRVRKLISSPNGARRSERIYLGDFEIHREFRANGTDVNLERESLRVMDDEKWIALVETQTVANGNALAAPVPVQRHQLGNHLGSASLELAADGALISYEEYHPYGTTAFQTGRSSAEVSLKRYRYTGKERDEESGLYYFGARYYAPWLGVWPSCDPALFSIGPNRRGDLKPPSTGAVHKLPQQRFSDLADEEMTPPTRSGNGSTSSARALRMNHAARGGGVSLTGAYVYSASNPVGACDPDGRAPIPATSLEEVRRDIEREAIPVDKSSLTPANDPHTEEHNRRVAGVVNHFLASTQGASKGALGNYLSAFQALLEERNAAYPKSSESLVLRDAQRYLYGVLSPYLASNEKFRSTTEEIGRDKLNTTPDDRTITWTGRLISEVWEPIYSLGKELAIDVGAESSIRTNPLLPASGVGGSYWYKLGSTLSIPSAHGNLEASGSAKMLDEADLKALGALRAREESAYAAALGSPALYGFSP